MSGSGNPWDPNQPDGSYYNPFPGSTNGIVPGTTGGGIDLSPSSNVGLFGSGYADWIKKQPPPDLVALGAPADFSNDGTGLPPSIIATPDLPMHTDPFASLREVLNYTNNDLGLPSPAGAQPLANAVPEDSSAKPASFNLYDMLHRGLNTQFGSGALQITHGLSQSMEKYGPYAAQLGTAGAIGGAVTGNLPFATGSALLGLLGAGMDELGHGLDAGTSFLKSIQQDNGQPLEDFKQRMETPGFYDLEFPDS